MHPHGRISIYPIIYCVYIEILSIVCYYYLLITYLCLSIDFSIPIATEKQQINTTLSLQLINSNGLRSATWKSWNRCGDRITPSLVYEQSILSHRSKSMALAAMITAHPTFAGGGRDRKGQKMGPWLGNPWFLNGRFNGKIMCKGLVFTWYSWMFQLCSLEVIQLKLDGFNQVLTGGSSLKSILGWQSVVNLLGGAAGDNLLPQQRHPIKQ